MKTKLIALLTLLVAALGCQSPNETVSSQDSGSLSSSGSADPFSILAVPDDPELLDFVNEFKSKFNSDPKKAIIDLGYWDGLSDEDRDKNVEELTADLGKTIEDEIKTIDYAKWDADEYAFSPEINGFELVHIPSHIMFFKSKRGPVSTDAYFAVFHVDGKYFLGTAKQK